MADTPKSWDRTSRADQAAMRDLLLPLVAASRSRDFTDTGSAKVQVLAFLQALEDVPRALVAEAVAARVQAGVTWMPKPGELKADCARLRSEARATAAKRILIDCPHTGHWAEDADGRVDRCACWQRAQAAMAAIGAPVQAPLLLEGNVEVPA